MPPAAAIRIHPDDDVAIAVVPLAAGSTVVAGGCEVTVAEDVPAGHKVALRALAAGQVVMKYGFPIGRATAPIDAGEHVHLHNLASDLGAALELRYVPPPPAAAVDPPAVAFDGYRRAGGAAGTRNEVWILPTVGCVNRVAMRIAERARQRFAGAPGVDGIHAFPHPFGCSQLGDDLRHTQRLLAGLLRHPNAGGVLVVGLGCENNQLADLLALAGDGDRRRRRYFNAQEEGDEIAAGIERLAELVAAMAGDRRRPCPAAQLVAGLKCGGSDGLSGVTANPLAGDVADRLTAAGGRALLSEVPEMFGAEQALLARALERRVFDRGVELIEGFKRYFERHRQAIDRNPSPGNRDGGITTLAEKSLGAIQKGGRAPVAGVLRYGEAVGDRAGLHLVEAPGNDGVSSTAMVAAGATVLLFTTGRGTPLGFPVPTIKIASNSALAARKPSWIDFDAGRLLAGTPRPVLAAELWRLVLDVASGRRTRNEENGDREIAIWKDGVTL